MKSDDMIYHDRLNWSNRIAVLLLVPFLLLGWVVESQAQRVKEPLIRAEVEEDRVFVYHTMSVSLDEGFNIYRKYAAGENFQKLNDQPVRGARSVGQFMSEVDEQMPVLQEAVEEDNPRMVYFRLQTDRLAANLSAFYYPDVARSLGQLYIDSTAVPGQTAIYKIDLVDVDGNPTGDSLAGEVALSTADPPQPGGLEAEHAGREVTLSWNYPQNSLEDDDGIVRFRIYDRQNGMLRRINEEPIVRVSNFEEFEHTFNAPRTGITYNFVVMPVSLTESEGPASEALQFTVVDNTPPSVISGLEAHPNENGEVELTWPVSTEADAAGYRLYRSDRIKGNYSRITGDSLGLLETLYMDRPPRSGTSYFYRVTAIDSSGNESERSNAAKADVEDRVPPPAPSNLTAAEGEDGTVQLRWEVAEQAPDLKSYVVLRRQLGRFSGSADAQLNQEDLKQTEYIDRGEADLALADGARYRYRVFAADSARNFSDTASVVFKVPDTTPPETPTRVTVENDRGVRILLSWNASTSNDVTEYLVYRGTSPEALTEYRSLSVDERFIRDDSVSVGTRYFYTLSAVDSLGNEGITADTLDLLLRDFTPPRRVRNVRTDRTEQTVTITWEPVPTADLNGYRVYSAEIPTGEFQPIHDGLIKELSFEIPAEDAGPWIRVRAVDTSGNESKPSEPVSAG